MLASTRRGTHDQGKPVSISVREISAIAGASAIRAKVNALSGTSTAGLPLLEQGFRRYSTIIRAASANPNERAAANRSRRLPPRTG